MSKPKPIPTCHPDRKHAALGLCMPCYKRHNYDKNQEKIKDRSSVWYAEHKERARASSAKYKKNNPDYQANWRAQNPEKIKASQEAWRQNNAKELETYEFERGLQKYEMTPIEYETLLQKQHGVCAGCGKTCGKNKRLSVDHDHATDHVRGLLCNGCNRGIGFIKDDPAVLRKLADYLDGHNKAAEILGRLMLRFACSTPPSSEEEKPPREEG